MFAETLPADQSSSGPRWQRLLAETALDIDRIMNDFPSAITYANGAPDKIAHIQQGLRLLTEPGQVVEVRILGVHGKKRTDSGYFDDPAKLARTVAVYDGKAEGLYFTLNPVVPALLARASNRVKEYAEHTTSDNDIVKRITLPIDFDPVRPAGISSTAAEHRAALERAWICRAWLTAQGWPDPVFASSGNGAHLLYAIDLPNDVESSALVKSALLALSSLFTDDRVKVDASTSNASRIFKLYGTLACKGDSTFDRPHRRAAILAVPAQRQPVTREQLATLAAQAPQATEPPAHGVISPPSSDKVGRARAYGKAALDKELAVLSATQDGNRNNQLFKSASALFGLVAGGALDRSEVWQALLNTARTIGLTETEARRTLDSGEKYGLSAPRSAPSQQVKRTDAKRTAPSTTRSDTAEPSQSPEPRGGSLLIHVDELDNLPPIRWLIQDLLPANSLVELHGAPSAGKTQVMFDMAQTLAASGQTVIYVVAEGLQGYRGRKRAWQQFRKQNGGKLFLWKQPVHLIEPPAVRQFTDTVKPQQPVLIVFDTLSRCSLGADENIQKDMNFILDALDTVRRETGATVVAVHHTNVAGTRERGSNVIRGGMDVMIEVDKDDDLLVVSCAKVKDSKEFDPIFLKPLLVDIGEENPVPVLVPAEKRTQTQSDKLTPLQLAILRAVGMEMFGESGIKSSQLDELLPPDTKRASKYHSLNTLIRLGYVKPHVKGDPYWITDEGRLKLSTAENGSTAAKSSKSNLSPGPFIWTLPEPSLMSSPIPHTSECGLDETLDQTTPAQTTDVESTAEPLTPSATASATPMVDALTEASGRGTASEQTAVQPTVHANVQPLPNNSAAAAAQPITTFDQQEQTSVIPMSPVEIARFAAQAGIAYPTRSGPDLYRIAALIPLSRRDAFEDGLGDLVGAYYEEIAKQGQEPAVQPIPDLLAIYLLPGLVTADELFAGYQRAWAAGHGPAFWDALRQRSAKGVDILKRWLNGNRSKEAVLIAR